MLLQAQGEAVEKVGRREGKERGGAKDGVARIDRMSHEML